MYQKMHLGVRMDKAGKISPDSVEYIYRESDGALIPCVEENADYQEYLKNKGEEKFFDYQAEKARQEAAKAEKKGTAEVERLVAEKLRSIAIDALVADGVLEEKDEKGNRSIL